MSVISSPCRCAAACRRHDAKARHGSPCRVPPARGGMGGTRARTRGPQPHSPPIPEARHRSDHDLTLIANKVIVPRYTAFRRPASDHRSAALQPLRRTRSHEMPRLPHKLPRVSDRMNLNPAPQPVLEVLFEAHVHHDESILRLELATFPSGRPPCLRVARTARDGRTFSVIISPSFAGDVLDAVKRWCAIVEAQEAVRGAGPSQTARGGHDVARARLRASSRNGGAGGR